MWVNKVGPYSNPQETYMFYSLPYCRPRQEEESNWEGLGEALQGYELRKSPMKINFRSMHTKVDSFIKTIFLGDIDKTTLCSQNLQQEEIDKFSVAVSKQYWYQLFLDDLPIWG